MDTSKGEAAVDKFGKSANKMAREVAQAADKAGNSVGQIGEKMDFSAEKINRQERSITASIKRTTAQFEQLGKTASQKLEMKIVAQGLDPAKFEPALVKLRELEAQAKRVAGASDDMGKSFKGAGAEASGMSDMLRSITTGGIAAFLGGAVVQSAMAASKAIYAASAAGENLKTMLNFATGGNGAKEIDFLRGVTDRLGLSFASTATAYGQFSAAAKGTALEGEKARNIFESVSKAAAVMGLSTEQSSGALLALQQMISKGTVQSEELRGQLGERLPGAFQIAAKAMGVTTAELGNMLEAGTVIADDFLPKFAKALEENLGGAAEKAADRLDAAVNRFDNAWERLKQSAGDSGTSKAFSNELTALSRDLIAITDTMEKVKASGGGMWSQLGAGAGVAVARTGFSTVNLLANTLNGTINALTGSALGLRTDLALLPEVFRTGGQQAAAMGENLKRAEADFAALKAQSAKQGSDIYFKSEMAVLSQYIAKLKEAQGAKADLTGVNPRDIPVTQTRGASYARYEAEQAEAVKALSAERMKAAGANKEYIASVKVYQDALRTGLVTEKEATNAIAELTKKRDEGTEAGKAAAKAATAGAAVAKAEQSAYGSLIASIREKIEADKATLLNSAALTASQKIRIKLDEDMASGKLKLSVAHKAEALAAIDSLTALEKQIKAMKRMQDESAAYLQTQDELNAAYTAESKAREQGRQAVTDYAKGIDESNDALKFEYSLMSQSAQAREIALEQYRIELDLKKQIAAVDANGGFDESQREEERVRLRAAAAIATANVSSKVMLAEWKTSVTQYDDIFRKGFADMVNGGKDSWKSFTKSLVTTFKTSVADQIYKMFAQPFVMKIVASLLGVTGGAGVSGLANAATGVASGGGLSTSSLGSLFGGSGGTGIAGSLSQGFASGAAKLGDWGFDALSNASLDAANTILQFKDTINMAGDALGYAGAIYSLSQGNYGAAAGAAIGTYFGGPIGAAIGSYLGGLVDRGPKESTGGGIEGRFSGSGFNGNGFSTWKQDGGWFHNDSTGKETSSLDAATTKQFSDSYKAVQAAASGAAIALGLSADAVTDYSESISIQLTADAAANQKAIAKVFGDLGDHMATAVAPGLSALAKEGESAGVTLSRLAGSLTTTNAWLSLLGHNLLAVSLTGGDAASKLADLFGGLENLAAASKSFYELYYTEGERAARSQEDIVKALATVNLAMPTSKEGLRALATSLDLSTEAGRKAYAVLLAIAPEFAATTDALARLAKEAAGTLFKSFSDAAQINMAGLTAALANVDTATFVETMALVFDNLATRIKGVIGSIATERAAVQDAILQINSPGVMTRDAIQRGIAGTALVTPGNAGLVAAQGALGQADAKVALQTAAVAQAKAQAPSTAALDAARAALDGAKSATAAAQSEVDRYRGYGNSNFNYFMDQAFAGNDLRSTVPNPSGERNAQNTVFNLKDAQRNQQPAQAAYDAALAAYASAAALNAAQVAEAQAKLSAAAAEQAAAVTAARTAQLAYIASLQDFAGDASKAVSKLGKLREETLKYYEAQKQLAELMNTSAAGLRESVRVTRMGQLDSTQSLAQQRGSFDRTYSLAQSTTGAVQAGYANTLAAALPGLSSALMDTATTREEWARSTGALFAQSEAIAAQLAANAPQNYAADSLAMLGQIDAALAVLDASSKSAEKIIADAVTAGSEKTAGGLRAVIAAMTGQPIPAFAMGGYHAGGMRLVGENGPEWENTGPSRIFSASQTRSMLSGSGSDEMLQELRALRQDNAAMREELQAIAGHTNKTARLLDRAMPEGDAIATRVAA